MKEKLPFSNATQLVKFVLTDCGDIKYDMTHKIVNRKRQAELFIYGCRVQAEYLYMLDQLLEEHYNKFIVEVSFYQASIDSLDLTKLRLRTLKIQDCDLNSIDVIPDTLNYFMYYDTDIRLPEIPVTLERFSTDEIEVKKDWLQRKHPGQYNFKL